MKAIIILLIISFAGCVIDSGPDKRDISILNKSENTIYCIISSNDFIDSVYKSFDSVVWKRGSYNILKDSVKNIYDKPSNWDEYINNCQDGKVRIFVISRSDVTKYGWEKVILKSICTRIYKVNIHDLNKCKWKITYKTDKNE
jgi:hypothetical protein